MLSSLSGAPPGRMCRCGPTPLRDRALRSALFSHRMGRRPRAGDYARLSPLGWHDADISSSLLIATWRSFRSLRLSRMMSSADVALWSLAHALTSVRSVTTRPPFCTPGFLFLRREHGASCVNRSLAGTSPKCCSVHASTQPLIGLICRRPAAPRSPEPQWWR